MVTTRAYSTSFSYAVNFLDKKFRAPIYSIYGFVRFADEIVDSFHDFDKKQLLDDLRVDTFRAIARGISLNPVLNSFQQTVRAYNIDHELIHTFLDSMETDLDRKKHDASSFCRYVLGSAEVVGLMCLKVFTGGDEELYNKLKAPAMQLGSAFQKVNFLRDIEADYRALNRTYFPGIDPERLTLEEKARIEEEIEKEFRNALSGIRQLPDGSRLGVYLAYVYYRNLFRKIRAVKPSRIMQSRVRISNKRKLALIMQSYIRYQLNYL
jgi:15-cis-phytoene synthase